MDSLSRPIKFDEHYKLDPIEKLKRFGIIPWELIIHLLLMIFTILQAIVLVNNKNVFRLAQEKSFIQLFNEQSNEYNGFNSYYIYTPNQLKEHVKKSIDTFFDIKNKTLDRVDHVPGNANPIIEFNYLNFKSSNKTLPQYHLVIFNATKNDLCIFDKSNEEIKKAINDLNNFKINYTLITQNRYIWNLSHKYDFSIRGHIISSINIAYKHSQYQTYEFVKHYFDHDESIHLIVFSFAFLSFYNTWRHISNISKKYTEILKKYEIFENEPINTSSSCDSNVYYNPYDSDDITLKKELSKPITTQSPKGIKKKKKRYIIQYLQWAIVCFIGNIIQLFGSGIALSIGITSNTNILIGIGALLASINIGRYIAFGNIYSGFYDTLNNSIPVVSRYLIGVFPIILGFLFFGFCIFWESERFKTVSYSIVTLFSLMQGDSIFDILTDLHYQQGSKALIGIVFGFVFVMLAILIIFNIFIQIINQSYVVAKLNNKSSWVYNHIHPVQPLPRFSQASHSIKRVQSMPKQIPSFVSLKKPKANSFFSRTILTNKNRELSNPEESYEKKSFNPRQRTRDIIDQSMSNRHSIMEDEERSASSHSKNESELNVIHETTIKYTINYIKNYFNSINSSLNHIKTLTRANNANESTQNKLKTQVSKDIEVVNKAIVNLKEFLLK